MDRDSALNNKQSSVNSLCQEETRTEGDTDNVSSETGFSPTQWKAVRTTRLRSHTLLQDGYRAEPTDRPGVYFVRRPRPLTDKRTGTVIAGYTVDLAAGTCDCPAYRNLGECKHKVAVLRAVAEALALVAPMLASSIPR